MLLHIAFRKILQQRIVGAMAKFITTDGGFIPDSVHKLTDIGSLLTELLREENEAFFGSR